MQTIEIKGFCKEVTPVLTKSNGAGQLKLQSLIVTVPGYTNSFQEKIGKDKDWEIQLVNKMIDDHKLLEKQLTGKPLIVTAYLDSDSFKYQGETKYTLSLRLKNVEVYIPKTV